MVAFTVTSLDTTDRARNVNAVFLRVSQTSSFQQPILHPCHWCGLTKSLRDSGAKSAQRQRVCMLCTVCVRSPEKEVPFTPVAYHRHETSWCLDIWPGLRKAGNVHNRAMSAYYVLRSTAVYVKAADARPACASLSCL